MLRRVLVAAGLLAPALVGLASDSVGATEVPADTQTIAVTMVDTAFEPPTVDVTAGQRVRFVFTNNGKVRHDAFIGTRRQQRMHERDMREAGSSDHGHGHDEMAPKAMMGTKGVTVRPGRTKSFTYTVEDPGTLEIGCHEPGHYADGMKIVLTAA